MATLKNDSIAQWSDGDNVEGFALLTKLERRQDKNGKDFLDLELADATGTMSAKAWNGSAALEGTYELHDFVAFKGQVKSYRDQLQISVQACRTAGDEDRKYGFDESLLIPSTREDIDDLWRRLETLYEHEIKHPMLRLLYAAAIAQHGEMLRLHPAAKTIHHACRGGLLEHVVSMAELATHVAAHYPEVDRELVLMGVLFHDLGKTIEIGAMPINEYTPPGRMVGHVVIGRDMLRDLCSEIDGFPEDVQLHLEHLILSHQGRKEFGSPVEPMTSEALVLSFVDDLDSKIAQLRDARDRSEGFQFLRPMGRYMFLGNGRSQEPDESDEPKPEDAPAPQQALFPGSS